MIYLYLDIPVTGRVAFLMVFVGGTIRAPLQRRFWICVDYRIVYVLGQILDSRDYSPCIQLGLQSR